MKYILIFALCVLAGCYSMGPEEGEISTVPVTNNPHALPGSMQTSPMPNVF